MYHHVGADKLSNSPAILEKHFQYIKDNLNIVTPGGPLDPDVVNICLVFDDASYSFYAHVFPLIKRIGVKVVLAVSPKFIVESGAHVARHVRLNVPADEMMAEETYTRLVPFCSWEELTEMSSSGVVSMASHSYSHPNLLRCHVVEKELTDSKKVLTERLKQEIDSFVYPYGQFNASIAELVRKHYKYSFAVGAGDNKTWSGVDGVLFRIFADGLRDPSSIFSSWNLRKYRFMRYRLFAKKWLMDVTPSA